MFDPLYSSYKKIISNIAIIGYSEKDIIKRGKNINEKLELTCLFSYPIMDQKSYNVITYEMMFPDGNFKIECPKFFSLCLTDEKGTHSFLYCLKLPEKYKLEIDKGNTLEINVPIVICIKSEKSDLEPFRQLLTSINQIIVYENFDYDSRSLNNYKKVELMNIIYFLFSLPNISPHSLIRLKLNNNICEVEDEIDFYFSSYCEIPCNKNDTDVNLLFLVLDQTIIIKVIISILSEKQIVFRASKAYLLHLIIPTFLKLIFPFKWIQTCITILPKENIDYLDLPGSFIIGVLSSSIEIQEILDEYPGKIIIDLDTNEIFGEDNSDPFIAPKEKIIEENIISKANKKNKDKDKEKEKEIINNNIGLKQGKNIFIVEGSFIYQYDPDNKGKKKKFKFGEKCNIIIDTQNSQFLMNKSNIFINSNEWKWLRKNIQLVRNPEIFEIENINNKNENSNENISFEENESPISSNRAFSYNIQNILVHFYLNKLSDINSDFMNYFKDTNLYLNYIENKKFQNNSGKRIIENIKETINCQRSIDNCFNIEYNKKNFGALSIIDELDKKIIEIKKLILINNNKNNNNNINNGEEMTNQDKCNLYNDLRQILMDYCLILGINYEQLKNEESNIEDNSVKIPRTSNYSFNKVKRIHFKSHCNKGHVKSNKSILQFTFSQNPNFNLTGIDKYSKNYFKFYGKDGFLIFLNNIDQFIKEEKKDIQNIVFKTKIYDQLINVYKNLENIFKNPNEENNEIININIDVLEKDFNESEENDRVTYNIINNISNNNINSLPNNKSMNNDINLNNNSSYIVNSPIDENSNFNKNLLEELKSVKSLRKTKNSIAMSMIDERDEENESYLERTSKRNYNKDNNMEDLGNILLNNIDLKLDENISDENTLFIKDEIITFPDFENKRENKDFMNQIQFENNNNIKKNKGKEYLCQYYLFLAYYLEEINSDMSLFEKFNNDIYNSVGVYINIKKFILKLYKEAYIHSGEKHRDFPYFTFYSFLLNLDSETLLKIENNLKEENNQNIEELYEIYSNILTKKKIKEKIIATFNCDYNGNSIYSDRSNTINNYGFGNNLSCSIGEDSLSQKVSTRPESFNNSILRPKKGLSTKSIIINNSSASYSYHLEENDCSKIIVINSPYNPSCKPGSIHILNEFCSLFSNCFPTKAEIKAKTVQQILNDVYLKINIQPIKELLGELKIIKLSELQKSQKVRLCFWLNSFNFLLLYSIFHLKLNIQKKENWKNLICNIKYNLGGYNFSFEDMLYILFQKNIFFPNEEYKPRNYVKKNIIDISKEKDIINLTPFLLYLPNKEFLKPIIYESYNVDSNIMKRTVNYLFSFIRYNENTEEININELIFISEPNFLPKGIKKYKSFIDEKIYKIIKHKKYKRVSVKSMKWELSFDYLLDEVSIES